jgi:uncharacterized membrane protein
MKRIVVMLGLLVLVAVPAAAQGWFKGSFGDALNLATTRNKLVLIDFGGPG